MSTSHPASSSAAREAAPPPAPFPDVRGRSARELPALLPWGDHAGPDVDAPVVVLLHAFPLDRTMWDDVVPLLTTHVRVVTVDLPGLGEAAVPDGEPSLAVAVGGVLAVLEHLRVHDAVVAGLSTGGYVAAGLAAEAPHRVRGLALLDTTTRVGAPDEPEQRRAVAEQVLGEAGLDAVMGSVQEGLSERARSERPELADRVRATIARQRVDGVAWMCRALAARPDTTEALRQFPGAVLLLFGEQDAATPPDERGAQLHEVRPGAELVRVPGGHLTALEAPQEVADALCRLVARTRAPERATVLPAPVHGGRTPRDRLRSPDLVAGAYALEGLGAMERAVVVQIRRTWPQPPRQVWASLTAQPGLGAWFGSWSGQAGGAVHVTTAYEDEVVREDAEVLVCEPAHRLVVSWRPPDGPGRAVDVVLEPEGSGTRLTFLQVVGTGALARDVAAGWHWYLDRLGAHLAGTPLRSWAEVRDDLGLLYG